MKLNLTSVLFLLGNIVVIGFILFAIIRFFIQQFKLSKQNEIIIEKLDKTIDMFEKNKDK